MFRKFDVSVLAFSLLISTYLISSLSPTYADGLCTCVHRGTFKSPDKDDCMNRAFKDREGHCSFKENTG